MTGSEYGIRTSLIPESTSTDAEGDPQRALRHADREVRADQHAGNRPDEEPGHRVQVDVPVQQMAGAGDPEQQRGVQHVGADDPAAPTAGRASSIASPKNVPEPTDVSPTTNPNDRADQDGGDLVTRAGGGTRRRSRWPRRNVFARKPSPPMISDAPTTLLIVDSVPVGERARDLHADERERRRADQHPQRERARARSRAAGGERRRTT